jgi:hypothetical protein
MHAQELGQDPVLTGEEVRMMSAVATGYRFMKMIHAHTN